MTRTAVAFDTHKFIKELKDSGVPEAQAEALQHAFSEAIGANLATRDDIKDDIKRLKHGIEQKMQIMEQRITIRLGSIMFIGIGALAAVIKFL